jgi:Mlc titration factor MtfA (ptsG expression regulator)
VVLLAWDAVRGGAANPFDGENVVLHKFAHQLDQEDGRSDGTPVLGRGTAPTVQAGLYATWARMLAKESDEFRLSIEEAVPVMNADGLQNPAEFFAVATECFFEKPQQLSKRHPELYGALKEFYQQDPVSWAIDSSIPRARPPNS